MNQGEQSPVRRVWDGMSLSVELSGLLTDPQHLAIAHGLTAVIGGAPDAFFGVKNDPCPEGSVLYIFYWVRGNAFGRAEIDRPSDACAGAPKMRSWVQPLTGIRKIDVESDVTAGRAVRSEYTVKLKVVAHWDDVSVDLDATGSMTYCARPELEKLIGLVLASI